MRPAWKARAAGLALALAAFTAAADGPAPAPPPAPAHIAALVADLDHARYDRRVEAVRRLVEIGEAALAPLRALAANPHASLEAKSRARQILETIETRREEAEARARGVRLGGGPVVGCLAAKLASERPQYGAKEPPRFVVQVMNLGGRPRTLTPVGLVGYVFPEASWTGDSRQGWLEVRRVSGTPGPQRGEIMTTGLEPNAPEPVELAAGARSEHKFSPYYPVIGALPPGEYEARFVYFAASRGLAPGLVQDLTSNPVRFRVLPAEPPKPDGKR